MFIIPHRSRMLLCEVLLYLAIIFISTDVNAMRQIPDDYLSYAVLIKTDKGGIASGFYIDDSHAVFLVTARHVLFKKDGAGYVLSSDTAQIASFTQSGEQWKFTLNLKTLIKTDCVRYHQEADVCIVEMGTLGTVSGLLSMKYSNGVVVDSKTRESIVGFRLNNIKKYATVLVGNPVYIFGYPVAIGLPNIPQIDYEKPLLRHGIIAGKNDTRHTLIIDCPAFPGNSGGPAVEVEQEGLVLHFKAIGVVTEYVPATITWNNTQQGVTTNISNSGYSIIVPIDRVLELAANGK